MCAHSEWDIHTCDVPECQLNSAGGFRLINVFMIMATCKKKQNKAIQDNGTSEVRNGLFNFLLCCVLLVTTNFLQTKVGIGMT